MPTIEIKRFNASLQLDASVIQFELHPVNIREKQLYQVYTQLGGKEYRFHMQGKDGKNFQITDKNRCPKEYLALESQLSDAILNS
jgi:hypothetical protein